MGLNLGLTAIIGAAILLVVIAYVVTRTRSTGKSSSPAETERGTRDLYRDEQAAHKDEPGSGL